MKLLVVVFVLLICSFSFGQPKTISTQVTKEQFYAAKEYGESDLNIKKFEAELLNLINSYRLEHNLNVLEIDTNLYKAALIQSDYMVSINKVTHNNSLTEYSTFSKRILYFLKTQKKYSVENCCTGNLVTCYYDGVTPAQQIFSLWKNSKGHNLNMLNPNISKIGLSLSRAPNYDYFYACFDATCN